MNREYIITIFAYVINQSSDIDLARPKLGIVRRVVHWKFPIL